jgi:hypothetical protein
LTNKCTVCLDNICDNQEHIEGEFDDRPVFFCSDCITALSEIIEEYYAYKYKEHEQATVH